MKMYNRYIRYEEDGSITGMILPPEDESGWIKTDVIRIIAEPGYILYHDGVCCNTNVIDTTDIAIWTEHPAPQSDW